MSGGGNPYHDPSSGEFTSAPGDHPGRLKSIVTRAAPYVAGVAAVLAGGAVVAALGGRSSQRSDTLKAHLRQQHEAQTVSRSLSEHVRDAHMKTLHDPRVRAAHRMGLINPIKKA